MSSPERSIYEGFHQEQYSIANTGLLSTQPDPLRDFDDDSDLSSPRPVTRSRQLEAAYELIPVTDDDSDHNLQNENNMEYDDDGTHATGLLYDDDRSDTAEQAKEAHSVLPALAQSQKPAKPSHGLSRPGQAISLASSGSGFWLEDFRAKPSQEGSTDCRQGNVAARASGKSSASFTISKVKFSARPWPEPAALDWPWLSLAHGSGFKSFEPEPARKTLEAHEEHVFNPQTPKVKKKRKAKEFDAEIVVRESSEPESEHGTDNLEQPEKKRKRLNRTANLEKSHVQAPQKLRRSPRVPYAPLEWWRNEKVEYGGRDPNGEKILVPRIRAIIRVPKVPIVPRKRSRRQHAADDKPEERKKKIVFLPKNPEEGWDNNTQATATVKALFTEQDVSRRIAFTARMYKPQFINDNCSWSFEKIFQDAEFIAAGQMVIERNARKPVRPSNDNTFIFLVFEGAVNVKIHETSFIVTSGGSFMVPRGQSISTYPSWVGTDGNRYFIENIADRPSKLFFSQARREVSIMAETRSLSPQVQRPASRQLSLARARDLQRATAPF
ncbi:Mif2/CENP-C like-domain-containing protein [Favolaschia claudopus]|uniref:Mif2/CENP-C like-domain-containing protein n=1 Tax=Favolaschia claudopus TaxID=2862362 RepID=A0AAV9ZEE4_9AGAR